MDREEEKHKKTEVEKYLDDYLNYLEIEKNRAVKTSENYGRYLRFFLRETGIRRASEITNEAVKAFRLKLARIKGGETGKELKKVTQSYYIIALRNFLKYLARQDVATLAAEKVEIPKAPAREIETIDYADLERMLAAPTGTGMRAARDRAILETLFSTGLRVSELCSLNLFLRSLVQPMYQLLSFLFFKT